MYSVGLSLLPSRLHLFGFSRTEDARRIHKQGGLDLLHCVCCAPAQRKRVNRRNEPRSRRETPLENSPPLSKVVVEARAFFPTAVDETSEDRRKRTTSVVYLSSLCQDRRFFSRSAITTYTNRLILCRSEEEKTSKNEFFSQEGSSENIVNPPMLLLLRAPSVVYHASRL